MNQYNSDGETDRESFTTDQDITDGDSIITEDEYYEDFYEPEEISNTKYNIVLCEKYNTSIHGEFNNFINSHYLTHFRLKELNNDLINDIKNLNPRVRTEIAECIILPSQHNICILKTFWLRLIQRVWKKIYRERKNIIKKRSNPRAIFYREICGRWPDDCLYYPHLKGMLSNLP
jgi:hypothetical protein